MKITQLEQSGVIIETTSGFRLAIDIGSYTPLEALDGVSVDAMLISHMHGDHLSPERIAKLAPAELFLNEECITVLGDAPISSTITRIRADEPFTVHDMVIRAFDVDHGPNVSVRPKENFGFLIEADGQTVYFAGDMFTPSGIPVTDLSVDTALIPVGTFYTFGPEEALAFVQQFAHVGTVLPMHFQKTPETKDTFVSLAQAAGITTV